MIMQPHIHRCACRPAGLSSYTPKHSVAFSKWQERALEHVPSTEEPPSKEVMVSRVGQEGGRPGKRGVAGVWAWCSNAWTSPIDRLCVPLSAHPCRSE